MEVKIKNNLQIYNVCRLKSSQILKTLKFHDDKSIKEHTVENESDMEETQIADKKVPNSKNKANKLIKNSIER